MSITSKKNLRSNTGKLYQVAPPHSFKYVEESSPSESSASEDDADLDEIQKEAKVAARRKKRKARNQRRYYRRYVDPSGYDFVANLCLLGILRSNKPRVVKDPPGTF
jgi:hypothetical protein